MPNECEGGCSINNECQGPVVKVRVVGPAGIDYGIFSYCQTAIQKDKDNGFYVEEVEDDL